MVAITGVQSAAGSCFVIKKCDAVPRVVVDDDCGGGVVDKLLQIESSSPLVLTSCECHCLRAQHV